VQVHSKVDIMGEAQTPENILNFALENKHFYTL